MHIPFDSLSGNSRIWIYQADRPLNEAEKKSLTNILTAFCGQWEAHGQPLKTSFCIAHDQFVVLGVDVDYSDTSGCSIDGSVRILKEFQHHSGIDFFNRNQVAFQEGTEVKTYPLSELKKLFDGGQLRVDSILFNNLVSTKSDLDNNWLLKAEKSWLKKYLPNSAVPNK